MRKNSSGYKLKFILVLLVVIVSCVAIAKGLFHSTIFQKTETCNELVPTLAKSLFDNENFNSYKSKYSFIVGGHMYGSHHEARQGRLLPAATLVENIDRLKSLRADFFVSLGDNYWQPEPKYTDSFISSVVSTLGLPFVIAPGNHDLGKDASIFCSQFGPLYYQFSYGSSQFIVLNTGLRGVAFLDDIQLSFLRDVIQTLNKTEKLKHLFILSHKFIWAPEDPEMQVISKDRIKGKNYREYNNINFAEAVLPILETVKKPVYWMSGDLKPLPLFFHEKGNVTYIATHLYDRVQEDAVIQTTVSNGQVSFRPVSLSGEKLELLEHYNVDYWEDWYERKSE